MKFWILFLLPCLGFAAESRKVPEPPAPCSMSVGIIVRTGAYRTWSNAFERIVLEERKGFKVCDDDVGFTRRSSRRAWRSEKYTLKVRDCKTEFRLSMRYKSDYSTRIVKIFRLGQLLYSEEFADLPGQRMSHPILRTIPTCEALQKLAIQTGK